MLGQDSASDSTIAREVFSELWTIVFLGALRAVDPIIWPFSRQLVEFIDANNGRIEAIMSLVFSACDVSPQTRSIFEEKTPQHGAQVGDPEEIATYLSFYARFLVEPTVDVLERGTILRAVGYGLDLHAVDFIDAMLRAIMSRRPADNEVLEELVRAVGYLVEIAGAGPSRDVAARQCYRMWRVAKLGDLLKPNQEAAEQVQAKFRKAAEILDALFGLPD